MKHKINSLLQERDAQIVALSSELKKIKNQLVYVTAQLQQQQQQQQQQEEYSNNKNNRNQQHDTEKKRKKKKALVTYGAVVHVQEAECDPRRGVDEVYEVDPIYR
jgi:aspartokinase